MKRIFLILCLITICNISYADIASVGYVDSVVATKQDTISDIETIRTGAGLGAKAVQPSSLSTVATSGSYNDLSNRPTIPTVNNATLTIQRNGATIDTFTANASLNKTINIIDNNTTYSNMTAASASAAGKAGLVPAPAAGDNTKFLTGAGTWAVPTDTNTTYSNMTAATASAAGKAGLVPAPAAGKQTSFLRGDGTWVVPTDNNTTYSTGTASTSGLTKLYTSTGTNTDGTMTQSAIKTALDGKQASITSSAKLSADLLSDGTTNKVVTATEKATWNAKQDALPSVTNNTGKVLKVGSNGVLEWGTDNNNTYTVNNKTLTIQQNGTSIGTFTANSATDQTVNITPMTAASASAGGASGLVPASAAGDQNKFLRADGTWVVPTDSNTTYSNMTAATASAAGKAGLVPAPAAGKQTSFLRGDGTWVVPTDNNTTYSTGTASTSGLTKLYTDTGTNTDGTMTQNAIKTALDGKQANLPTTTTANQVLKSNADGTLKWASDNNTTYSTGTASTSGLTKLYTSTGTNTDGTMTQSAIKTALDGKQDKLPNVPSNNGKYKLVWNSNTGQIGWEFEQFSLTCPSGTYDIGFSQCVAPATPGTASGYRNDSTGDYGGWSENADTYGLTTDQTWGITFSYGIVKGIASCNGTSGTSGQSTTANFSQSDKGRYCWCRMTSPAVSRWVFIEGGSPDSADDCADGCAYLCSDRVRGSSNFRSNVFGSVGQ